MVNSKEKSSSSSAKLAGFAAAAGSGAGSWHVLEPPTSPAAAASASSAAVAAAAGGGAGTESVTAKKPAAAAPQGKRTKKRGPKKGGAATASAASSSENNDAGLAEETVLRPLSDVGSAAFEPMSLPQIQLRLKAVLDKLPDDLPEVPPKHDPQNNDTEADAQLLYAPIKSFAANLQIAIEEYNLLLSLVSSATYKWGVDRSGASQQNLSVMSAELQQCQDVISNVVSARLSNVLCPAVEPLIGEVEIVREGGTNGEEADASATPAKKRKLNEDRLSATAANNNERRINHFIRPLVDPSYVHLCHCILARNGPLLRHTVATSIHTAQRVIGDYLNAMKKDSSHEAGKGGYY